AARRARRPDRHRHPHDRHPHLRPPRRRRRNRRSLPTGVQGPRRRSTGIADLMSTSTARRSSPSLAPSIDRRLLHPAVEWVELSVSAAEWDVADPALLGAMLTDLHL